MTRKLTMNKKKKNPNKKQRVLPISLKLGKSAWVCLQLLLDTEEGDRSTPGLPEVEVAADSMTGSSKYGHVPECPWRCICRRQKIFNSS